MLTVHEERMGRITVVEETDTRYDPVFEIYYVDEADTVGCPPMVRGRKAALAFARKLVALYNGAVEAGWQ